MLADQSGRPIGDGSALLGLNSGYIQRSAHLLPRQGSKFPWQVHQSYLRDYRALKMTAIEDGVMEFSNPVHHASAVPVASSEFAP